MVFEKLDTVRIKRGSRVRLKSAGNVMELFYTNRWGASKCPIKRLDADRYVHVATGEVLEFKKIENRSESKESLRRTFQLIRDTINANVTDINRVRWVTLTYKENMTDTKRLYRDLEVLRKKVKYHIGKFEYISVIEPQGRGAWHSHELWIFDGKAPYVDQKWIESDLWKMGSVKIKKLDPDNDNLGAYLTAYLGDVPLDEYDGNFAPGTEIREVEVENESGEKVKKRIVKGGRLHMYPPKMNIFRTSRGVKRAEVDYMRMEEAQKKIGASTPTFEKHYRLTHSEFTSEFSYSYYNRLRPENKQAADMRHAQGSVLGVHQWGAPKDAEDGRSAHDY